MKRSNRLILLVGVVLAVVAFGGILFVGSRPAQAEPVIPMATIVAAKSDIAVGTALTGELLEAREIPEADVPANSYSDPRELEGFVVRRELFAGETINRRDFQTNGTAQSAEILRSLEAGMRAMAVQVDQVTGVGTLIQPGDRVDVIIAVSDDDAKYPVVGLDPTAVDGEAVWVKVEDGMYNGTSVKVLIQNVQVIGTLLPAPVETGQEQAPPPADETDPAAPEPESGTGLTEEQQQVAILAVTPQQVELIRFAQLDGNLSLVLRSPADAETDPDETTGITLAELMTDYGVIKPELLEVILPPR
ncbi:MAG: Flp pilus assembly protein CpaB [Chloroflexi bacterium]|nr:Flp pilus assembly protein CpaB [Chloroflexota bacterium]